MTLIKFLAIVGLLSILFCCTVVYAAIIGIVDRWYSDDETDLDDEEQAAYLEKWRKEHEKH